MDLGRISIVTIGSHDLDSMIEAYRDYLGYRLTKTGKITKEEATHWQAKNLTDSEYVILQPEESDDFSFRFIQQPNQPDYIPFKSEGWNAAELIVQNVDKLSEELIDSPFEIIGPPADLSFNKNIRAMQIIGPAKEILYLTEFKRKVSEFDSPVPRCYVDKTFIVILAGKSLEAMQIYFHDHFLIAKAPIIKSRIRSISRVFDLPEETQYQAAAMTLRDQCFIELDELPKEGISRVSIDGYLPSGIAMVSFLCYKEPKHINNLYPSHLPGLESSSCSMEEGSVGEFIELSYC
jgi:hypothetical protein